ncbi:carboxypeptidase-like regulatory domain-containing protein [Hymenobacter aquaticus]|uniref:Carboxypeptidase-like regulatory domain-containing protein n=1 Tax=Hymenobacter aquaticus TaxID=1867101 RepID=A0A4Z0Q398_9BACT|nr:carboxypeptidase-like regulatory domain-containing protein [Hymenobacter aquaticus]TGE24500.1 carboxypeptidase-like regulatory domain-containing protein [Hymenobacter aquaticus]
MLLRLLAGLLLLLLPATLARAQTVTVTGQVLNARTQEPVPFAILGVRGKAIGTAADEQGRYLLRLPSTELRDTLIISCVGYEARLVPPAQLGAGQRVFQLTPQPQVLREVTIQSRRVKPGKLGRATDKADVRWMGGSSGKTTVDDEWGWEIGALLTPERRSYLEELHVYFTDNKYELLRFRLNLYTVKNGRPDQLLSTQDVQLICPPTRQGWLKLDLRPYNIELEAQPVAATLQWLQSEKKDPEDKYFSIPVIRQKQPGMVERENGHAAWTVHNLLPSLYFTVLTEEKK